MALYSLVFTQLSAVTVSTQGTADTRHHGPCTTLDSISNVRY